MVLTVNPNILSPPLTCKNCEGQVHPRHRKCSWDQPRSPEWSASSSGGTHDPSPSRSHCRGMTPHHPQSSLLGLWIAQKASVGVTMQNMLASNEGNMRRCSTYQFGRNSPCSQEDTDIQSLFPHWRMCRHFCMDWGCTQQLQRKTQLALTVRFKSSVQWDLSLININPAYRPDVMVLVVVTGRYKSNAAVFLSWRVVSK